MVDKKIQKMFAIFLKENNALKKYLYNIRKYQETNFGHKTLYELMNPLEHRTIKNPDEYLFISAAFAWNDTKEPQDFWLNLHQKWINLLNSQCNENNKSFFNDINYENT